MCAEINKVCSKVAVRAREFEASKGEIFLKKSSPILRETFRGMALRLLGDDDLVFLCVCEKEQNLLVRMKFARLGYLG